MRAGFWERTFKPVALWVGDDNAVSSMIPGERLEIKFDRGKVVFRRGVLFHPTAPIAQRLENILILESISPDMFEYDCWEKIGDEDLGFFSEIQA